jgi:adenine-specific DNA-methyltransferase
MDIAKLKILEETLKNKFDIKSFQKFTREFFNGPEMMPESRRTGIWREYADYVEAYYTVAKYKDSEGKSMIILAVELKKGKSVERARSMQRNFISKVLDINNLEAAMVAFYSNNEPNWRLSFVRLDYTLTDKGIELDLTPARRYSYLVGENEPNHTAQAQLLTIFEDDAKNPTLDEIEKAFSVEKVTIEFFNLYKAKYLDLKEHLIDNEVFINETKKLGLEVDKFSEQFAKKLMGQLAFLYFLQKKGWLGVKIIPDDHFFTDDEFKGIYMNQDQVRKSILEKTFKRNTDGDIVLDLKELSCLSEHEAGLLSDCFVGTKYDMPWGSGNRAFVRELFNECIEGGKNKNFFNDYLEPFFYDALHTKRKNNYFKAFNCKIPFLNGGLFEPLEGYHWRDINFDIPNEIFSNISDTEEKRREMDANIDSILDIFDRFNFTMNEDEPLEKEVAIDPEMLGKIFENLLEVRDRKSKGAFYTPREIVHYMCQQSLINYLVNEVDVPYEDMKEFILYGELIRDADSRRNVGYGKEFTIKQSIFDNIVKIDNALRNVRIADPAVGSGAFPLGMINEIIKTRNNITEYIIRKDKEGVFNREYGEEFIRKWRSPYKMKLDTIKNSIFAVDIEPSAVDIAKLRLWLSLVVDQEIDEDNLEPQPLPNLDCNIMAGNSLIDEYEGIQLFDKSILSGERDNGEEGSIDDSSNEFTQLSFLIDDTDKMLEEMFDLQDRYFDEENEETKIELKKKIDSKRDSLIKYKLQRDNNIAGLKRYEESLKNKTRPYFIWELEFARVFKEKGGFDIVIGNPPYIGFHHVPNKEYFKSKYFVASGKYDFYILFIEKGLHLLKRNGIISYICPSYFYIRNYGKNTRKKVLNETKILYIADFKDSQIFDSALTYTCIFAFQKTNNNKKNELTVLNRTLKLEDSFVVKQESLREPSWILENEDSNTILLKVKSISNYKFKDITKSISQGIVTGFNEIFLLEKSFIQENEIEMDYLKPAIKGKDIRNGRLVYSNQYLFYPYDEDKDGKNICIPEDKLKRKCPNLYSYLKNNKEKLLSREYFAKSGKLWYELWNPRKKKHFTNRKFVFPEINKINDFVLVDECYYTDSACGAELIDEFDNYEKYIQMFLNSKLITYVYRKISVPKANGYLIYKNAFLKGLPILINKVIEENIDSYQSMKKEEFDNFLYLQYSISHDEVMLIEKELSQYEQNDY